MLVSTGLIVIFGMSCAVEASTIPIVDDYCYYHVCLSCDKSSDCGPTNDCVINSCVEGLCAEPSFIDSHAILQDPKQGDCKKTICDGFGNYIDVEDSTDIPFDYNPCTKKICDKDNPITPAQPQGTQCQTVSANGLCDGKGQCVETCSDGIQNQNETGIDCGGSCLKCNGTDCTIDSECGIGICSDTSYGPKCGYPAGYHCGDNDYICASDDCDNGLHQCNH